MTTLLDTASTVNSTTRPLAAISNVMPVRTTPSAVSVHESAVAEIDGVEQFTAFRVEKETAFHDEWEAIYREFFGRHGQRFGGDAGSREPGGAGSYSAGSGLRDADFEFMGLDADVTEERLKRRFRELAFRHHPDTGGSEAEFMRLKNVYDRIACSFRGSR